MATNDSVPLLSDLLQAHATRRSFVAAATALAGALVAGCEPEREPANHQRNAPSPGAAQSPASAGPLPGFTRYDPELPAPTAERTKTVRMTAEEHRVRIADDTVVDAWSFGGTVPGPLVRARVGDTVEFALTNHGDIPHSMDFHAAQIDPKTAFRSVLKGETAGYTFRPRHAGAFLYHCGTQPVLMHMGMGMYGAIVVDPPEPLPRAREFVLVHSEFYLDPATAGELRKLSYTQMLTTLPDLVCFNGYSNQYVKAPIRVKRGERVRFYVVNAGPTIGCAFHIVGEQFDTVYLGAPPGNAIRGVQTWAVAAGGGMIFELVADVAGEFPFVNHQFGHGQKGAMGHLVVEE